MASTGACSHSCDICLALIFSLSSPNELCHPCLMARICKCAAMWLLKPRICPWKATNEVNYAQEDSCNIMGAL